MVYRVVLSSPVVWLLIIWNAIHICRFSDDFIIRVVLQYECKDFIINSLLILNFVGVLRMALNTCVRIHIIDYSKVYQYVFGCVLLLLCFAWFTIINLETWFDIWILNYIQSSFLNTILNLTCFVKCRCILCLFFPTANI